MSDLHFLDEDEVLALHAAQLVRYGGGAGVRDHGGLASAVGMPQATFDGQYLHEDLFAMAAAYAFHLAQNHPFVDGNKRIGLLAALVFLELNGVETPGPTDQLFQMMLEVAKGERDKATVARALRELCGAPQ